MWSWQQLRWWGWLLVLGMLLTGSLGKIKKHSSSPRGWSLKLVILAESHSQAVAHQCQGCSSWHLVVCRGMGLKSYGAGVPSHRVLGTGMPLLYWTPCHLQYRMPPRLGYWGHTYTASSSGVCETAGFFFPCVGTCRKVWILTVTPWPKSVPHGYSLGSGSHLGETDWALPLKQSYKIQAEPLLFWASGLQWLWISPLRQGWPVQATHGRWPLLDLALPHAVVKVDLVLLPVTPGLCVLELGCLSYWILTCCLGHSLENTASCYFWYFFVPLVILKFLLVPGFSRRISQLPFDLLLSPAIFTFILTACSVAALSDCEMNLLNESVTTCTQCHLVSLKLRCLPGEEWNFPIKTD